MRRAGSDPAPSTRLLRVAVAVCIGGSIAVQAQTVYRCGPAGNEYSQRPCPEGRAVDVSDPRSPTQAAEARAEWAAQERWAQQARRERLREERANLPAGAVGIGPSKTATPRSDDKAVASKQPGRDKTTRGQRATARNKDFVALAPDRGKKDK